MPCDGPSPHLATGCSLARSSGLRLTNLKDGKERDVPAVWEEFADAWLQGFDGEQMAGAGKAKPISDQMKAEIDEAGVSKA